MTPSLVEPVTADRLLPLNARQQLPPLVLMFGNNKGGTGKSLTVVQIAAALARAGFYVLVVDMDPQGNATRRLGIEQDPEEPIAGTPEVIAANTKGAGEGATYQCGWTVSDDDLTPSAEAKLIDVIPSRPDLINRETETGLPGAALRLKKALSGEWINKYDVVLIDSQPDLGHLVQLSIVAADQVVLVTDAMRDGVEAAFRVDDYVTNYGEDLGNPNVHVSGVVVNRWRRTSEGKFYVENWLKPRFGDRLWNLRKTELQEEIVDGKKQTKEEELQAAWIPEWARLSEADGAGVSLTRWTDARGRETLGIFDTIVERYLAPMLQERARA